MRLLAWHTSRVVRFPRAGYEECIWDHAAGSILVDEAGGRVTDASGAPLDFSLGRRLSGNQGLVVTNGVVHDAVLAAVRAAQHKPAL